MYMSFRLQWRNLYQIRTIHNRFLEKLEMTTQLRNDKQILERVQTKKNPKCLLRIFV